ncbi:MAG: hypothetical protein QOE54_4618 [Streptosporangiaceae bacterium]|jgi:hypothetical protein|nr:hypothetical protein [Streptosporangiaceae bacterium]MDX6432252.1 hypothetical protein [Streptosporangiaceae bacterium]
MTITITIPTLALQGDIAGTLRSLLPLFELVAFAIAGAGGAGILLHLGLNIGFKLARHALQN